MTTPQFLSSLPVTNTLGEGVIWDAGHGALWWTDIESCKLYRYRPEQKQLDTWVTSQRLACFALMANSDWLLAGFESGFAFYQPSTGATDWLHRIDTAHSSVRLNDGRADRQGRFWAGSMVEAQNNHAVRGELYCLDRDLRCTSRLGNLAISNGLCWSPDSTVMYHTDTPTRRINAYDFDSTTGEIANRRLFVETAAGCFPDGSTVDSQGYLWNAQWGASQVVRYSPAGEVDTIVKLPVSQPSCVAFGGPNLDRLFITTARQGLSGDALARQPEAGNVLIYQTDIRGIADPVFGGVRK